MRRLEKAIILAFLVCLPLVSPAVAAETNREATKRVLAIFFSEEGQPFTFEIAQSLRTKLVSKSQVPVELNIEFADRLRYADSAYLQKFIDLLQYKYSQSQMDVVIGVGDESASFLAQEGETLFGDVPMILLTVKPHYVQETKPHLKNLVYGFDVLGQVLLIEKLLPEARHLFVTHGCSQSDREGSMLVRESLRNYQGPLEVVYLTDMSKEALLAKVARLPEHAVVLFTSFIRDAEGKTFVSRDVISEVAEAANAPVFGFFDIYLGYGMVGGYLISAGDQGERLANVALQLLKGDAPAAIDTAPPENRFAFDWHQLSRWGIDEKRLPPKSEVLFKVISPWVKYRYYIIATVVVIFLQSALVLFLVVESVRRRRAEANLTQRLAFEEILSELLARFVVLPPVQVNSQIAAELRKLGEHLQMDRITLFEFSESNQRMVLVESYSNVGVPPPIPRVELDPFTWASERVLKGKGFHFSDPEELPAEAAAEKAFIQSQGIRSAVIIPVPIDARARGMLILAMVTAPREWARETIRRYEIIAHVIASAIANKRSNEALVQSRNYNRSVLDSLTSLIAVLDREGNIMDVNEGWMQAARENDAPSLTPIGIGANYLEVCRRSAKTGNTEAQAALEGIGSVLEGTRETFDLEYSCESPGKKQWFIMKVIPFFGLKGRGIISHSEISEQKLAQINLQTAFSEIERLKNQLEAESAYLQEEIRLEHNHEGIIGQSAAIQYVLYKIEKVAATDTTVLILGENGTGKELVCRAIHSHSTCKARPLVKVNCAALPATLIESELFGHERGAFTGAQSRRTGRFELAHGSALFLDEIGELPLELQGKLLQVLEDGEFERLGSSVTVKIDVRVIAATNRNLEKMVREGAFREDLYYRLNVFPITVPPLRERREDIPLLTRFFVEQTARKLGKTINFVPNTVMTRLQEYRWPGNVRELQNVIQRAVINSTESKLRLVDNLSLPDLSTDSNTLKSLEEIETSHIVRVLEKTNWRIDGPKGAATILKINPSTLRSRMRKLGIGKP